MNIRQYEKTDRAACIEIFNSNTPRFFDPAELAYFENWLTGKDEGRHSYKSNKEEKFYVIEMNDEVVGCGGFYVPIDEPRGNMVWGMVHNRYHGKGAGRELFLYRVQQVQEHFPGCAVSLDTSQHTFGFFEKLGFKVVKVEKDAYGVGLDRYDMLL